MKQAVSEKVDNLDGSRMDPLFQDHAHVGPNFAELDLPSIDDVKKLLGQFQASPPTCMVFQRRCSSHARIFSRHSSPDWLLCRSVMVNF